MIHRMRSRRSVFFIFLFSLLVFLSSTLGFGEVAFFGRDLKTYQAMFCFSDEEIANSKRRILDVASGPSTFIGELKVLEHLHPDSRAFDPGYYHDQIEKVRELANDGIKQAFWPYYDGSYREWELADRTRFEKAHDAFKATHSGFLTFFQKYPDLYVRGEISDLPVLFKDRPKFDLVLSANLLFLYHAREKLDAAFHEDAILRMTQLLAPSGELRIFPLDDFEAKNPKFLPALISNLRERELSVERREGCSPSTGQMVQKMRDKKGEMLVIRHRPR